MSEAGSKEMVPAIRFNGFYRSWVEKPLDDIYSKIRNAFVGTATPYYVESGNFYLESNNVKNGKINRSKEVFISDEFHQKQSDKWLVTGDIVMVQSGHVGHTAVIPPELNNTAAHALIMFTNPKEKISPHFLNMQFQTDKSKAELAVITTGNTIKHILSSEMKEFEVNTPSFEEQAKIGEYFQQLDTLIAGHRKKQEKLLQLKKSLLEKMFPKRGENKPEIRFPGFDEDWVETELGQEVTITMGHSPSGTCYTNNPNDHILVQGNADMKNGVVVPRVWTTQVTKTATAGELIFSVRAPVGQVGKTDYDIVIGRGVAAINGNEFIFQSLKRMDENGDWKKRSAGSTFESINSSDLSTAKLVVAPQKEQTKIGELFKHMDTLIDQHQSQITKLLSIKQACLAKMFV